MIYDQLETDRKPEPDRNELQSFIRNLTRWESEEGGKKTKEQG
jgi:hypothetical protein